VPQNADASVNTMIAQRIRVRGMRCFIDALV
jgi:hypothetical protein